MTQAEEKYHIQEAMADYHALYPPYNPLPRLTPEQIDALNSRPLPKFEDMLEDIYKGMEANGYDVRNAWASRLLEATMLPSKPLPTASEPGRDAPMDAVLLSAEVSPSVARTTPASAAPNVVLLSAEVPPEMARMAADVEQSDQEIVLPYDYDASLHESRPWDRGNRQIPESGESSPWDRTAPEERKPSNDAEKKFLKKITETLIWIRDNDPVTSFIKRAIERALTDLNELAGLVLDITYNLVGYVLYFFTAGYYFKKEFHTVVSAMWDTFDFLSKIPGWVLNRKHAISKARTLEEFLAASGLELILKIPLIISDWFQSRLHKIAFAKNGKELGEAVGDLVYESFLILYAAKALIKVFTRIGISIRAAGEARRSAVKRMAKTPAEAKKTSPEKTVAEERAAKKARSKEEKEKIKARKEAEAKMTPEEKATAEAEKLAKKSERDRRKTQARKAEEAKNPKPRKEAEKNPRDGAERAAKYSANWQTASMKDAIARHVGKDVISVHNTERGKIIHKSHTSPIQVVEDTKGKYFTIEDTRIKEGRKYLDLNGNNPDIKTLPNGKQTSRSRDEYRRMTHFNIGD